MCAFLMDEPAHQLLVVGRSHFMSVCRIPGLEIFLQYCACMSSL